jgi:hypothetical protein
MAHFVPFPWHISFKVFLCRAVAHFVPSRGTFCAFPWHILFLPVAHGILFPLVKNCKSRIARPELHVNRIKMNERIFGLVLKPYEHKFVKMSHFQIRVHHSFLSFINGHVLGPYFNWGLNCP